MNIYYLKKFRKKYGYYYTKDNESFILLNFKDRNISDIINKVVLLKQYNELEFVNISFEEYFNNKVYELVFSKLGESHKYQRGLRSFRNKNKK